MYMVCGKHSCLLHGPSLLHMQIAWSICCMHACDESPGLKPDLVTNSCQRTQCSVVCYLCPSAPSLWTNTPPDGEQVTCINLVCMSADSFKSIMWFAHCITWFDHCTMWFEYCTLWFDHCIGSCLKHVQALPNMSTHVMSGPGQATCNCGGARSANNAISVNIYYNLIITMNIHLLLSIVSINMSISR